MRLAQMWALKIAFIGLCLSLFAPMAFADFANGDIITMRLTGGGSPNFDIGPYPALVTNINGTAVSKAIQVVCDSVDSTTVVKTDYTFQVHTMDSLTGTKFASLGEPTYFQAAWLTGKLLDLSSASYSAADCFGAATFGACKTNIQNTIWDLFKPTHINPDSTSLTDWKTAAIAATTGKTAADFADYRILTPWCSTCTTVPANPQEFIIRTPEGSAIALLGANMLGLVGLVRFFRRRRQS